MFCVIFEVQPEPAHLDTYLDLAMRLKTYAWFDGPRGRHHVQTSFRGEAHERRSDRPYHRAPD
jgi:hypothetical protein